MPAGSPFPSQARENEENRLTYHFGDLPSQTQAQEASCTASLPLRLLQHCDGIESAGHLYLSAVLRPHRSLKEDSLSGVVLGRVAGIVPQPMLI